jgi:hypothetical protein
MTDLKTERSTHQSVRDRLAEMRRSKYLENGVCERYIRECSDLIEALLADFGDEIDTHWTAKDALQKFGEGR